MKNSAQEQLPLLYEGGTIRQVEKESKKPRSKWLPRLAFLRPKQEDNIIKSNVVDYQAVDMDEELTSHLEINFDGLRHCLHSPDFFSLRAKKLTFFFACGVNLSY